MSAPVTVYSKPQCVQCDATKRHLDKHGIPYTPIDLTRDPDALAYVQGLGYLAAPVVVTGDTHWSGYVPDKLNTLTANTNPEN